MPGRVRPRPELPGPGAFPAAEGSWPGGAPGALCLSVCPSGPPAAAGTGGCRGAGGISSAFGFPAFLAVEKPREFLPGILSR